MKLRHLADIVTSNVDKKSVDGQTTVRLCNYTDVYNNPRIKPDHEFMTATASDKQIRQFALRAGDVLITKDSETPDDIGVPAYVTTSLPGVLCGYHLAVLRPRPAIIDGRYLYWAVAAEPTRRQFDASAFGITRFGLRQDAIANATVPLPNLTQQRAIADFLDAETDRLDELIKAKQRMIDLLRERLSSAIEALLSSATLEPVRLRYLCLFIQDGTHQPPERVPSGYPLLSVRNLVEGEIVMLDDDSMVAESDFHQLRRALSPQQGDVALAIVGATLGKVAVVGDLPPFALQRSVAILRPDPNKLNSSYLKLAMQSLGFQALLWSRVAFSAQPGVYLEEINNLAIPWAPVDTQRRLLEDFDAATRERLAAGRLLLRHIDLLHERRQALITAAITGQIPISGAA